MLTASRERGVIGCREIDAQHPEDRGQDALGLTQRSVEDETERQGGFDGEIGILELPAPPADASRCPRGDRVGREPEGDVASPHEGSVVLGPVPDAIRCRVLRMHSRLHIEIMTRRRSRWSTCRPLLAHRAESAHQRPSALADAHGLPRGDRFRRQPQGDVASLDQCSVVRRPVSDAVFRFVPGMHSRLHVEIMPLRPSRWPGPRRTLVTAHQRPASPRHPSPGAHVFLESGWLRCGTTAPPLLVLRDKPVRALTVGSLDVMVDDLLPPPTLEERLQSARTRFALLAEVLDLHGPVRHIGHRG